LTQRLKDKKKVYNLRIDNIVLIYNSKLKKIKIEVRKKIGRKAKG